MPELVADDEAEATNERTGEEGRQHRNGYRHGEALRRGQAQQGGHDKAAGRSEQDAPHHGPGKGGVVRSDRLRLRHTQTLQTNRAVSQLDDYLIDLSSMLRG